MTLRREGFIGLLMVATYLFCVHWAWLANSRARAENFSGAVESTKVLPDFFVMELESLSSDPNFNLGEPLQLALEVKLICSSNQIDFGRGPYGVATHQRIGYRPGTETDFAVQFQGDIFPRWFVPNLDRRNGTCRQMVIRIFSKEDEEAGRFAVSLDRLQDKYTPTRGSVTLHGSGSSATAELTLSVFPGITKKSSDRLTPEIIEGVKWVSDYLDNVEFIYLFRPLGLQVNSSDPEAQVFLDLKVAGAPLPMNPVASGSEGLGLRHYRQLLRDVYVEIPNTRFNQEGKWGLGIEVQEKKSIGGNPRSQGFLWCEDLFLGRELQAYGWEDPFMAMNQPAVEKEKADFLRNPPDFVLNFEMILLKIIRMSVTPNQVPAE